MPWLIAARTVQGLGGGAILQIVNIVISDIVALKEYVHLFISAHNILHPFFEPRWRFADAVLHSRGKYGGLLGEVCFSPSTHLPLYNILM